MSTNDKVFISTMLAIVGAFVVLGTVWWFNGSEKDDAWLYAFCAWLIVFSGWEVYAAWKKRKSDK